MTESVTESASEMEIQAMGDSWVESVSHLRIQSRCKSASHSHNESVDDSWIESWNKLPNAGASDGQIPVWRPAPRAAPGLESNTV